MNILFHINNIPPDYGGGYLRVFRTAARFKTYGALYRIATYTNEHVYTEETMGIGKQDIIFFRNKFVASFLTFPWQIIKNRKKYDVLYVASVRWHTLFPSLVAKCVGKKVVHGVTLSMVDSPATITDKAILKPYYVLKNSQFKLADYIFVNSPLLVEECVNCGLKRDRVKLINNPVDITLFHPVSHDDKIGLRKDYGLPINALTILFVGSINKRKGCDILPSIFELLFSTISSQVTFVMCGQKGYPETEGIISELEAIFKKYNNTFIVKEEEKKPAPYYQMSDIFLFPTTNEGMPNVVLEAMSCECMIACNTLPGITDHILGEQFRVNGNNIDQYARLLSSYIENPSLYEEGIKANRKKIVKDFSVDAVDKYILQLLA